MLASLTALTQSSPCLDVARESLTTSRYSTKLSLASTGALVATAPATKLGYLIRNHADRLPVKERERQTTCEGKGDYSADRLTIK